MITVKEIEKVFSPTWDKEILRKIKCFADFIGCDAEDIEDIGIDDDGEVLTFYGDAYYVLTDDQADEKVGKYIKETVWAFNSNFIAGHCSDGIHEEHITALRGDSCEDVNDALIALIEAGNGMKHFIDDAVGCDGRGHYINNYDGNENEVQIDGIDFFIYHA